MTASTGRLQGKVAIVVGAGQTPGDTIGNGRATAIRFAQEGAKVVLVDRREASARETLHEVESYGGEGIVVAADVTQEGDCQAMIEACTRRFGTVDVLHNNVGIGAGDSGPTHMTEAVWDRIHSVNLKSALFTCKHALPVMRAQGSGVITNISSVAAVCSVGIVAYKTSKAALNAFTQSLAIGNARYGIRANVIMPGLMNTPMAIEGYVAAGRDREQLVSERDAQVPLRGKMGTAWDVANAAVFLASDEAGFITGVCLPVDGGQSARVG
ncbi:MAG: SDR family oxidoreductase [Gammaproteobacteria bacterium]|nr:SDR family oxidoreductase [Gammaproteobacteria bacterium]